MLKPTHTSTSDSDGQTGSGTLPQPQLQALHTPQRIHQAASGAHFFSPPPLSIDDDSMDGSDVQFSPVFSAANDSLQLLWTGSFDAAEGEAIYDDWNDGGVLDLLNTSFYDFGTSSLRKTEFLDPGIAPPPFAACIPLIGDTYSDLMDSEGCLPEFLTGWTPDFHVAANGGYHG